MSSLEAPSEIYIMCPWCNREVLPSSRCSYCKLSLVSPEDTSTAPVKEPKKVKREKPTRESKEPFKAPEGHTLVLGIDPGARYTGIVVRDNDIPIYSSIFVRPVDMKGTEWTLSSVKQAKEVYAKFKPQYVAIENVTDPKGFYKGKQAAINPKDIIRTAMVLGGLVIEWPDAIIVDPGGNGDLDDSFYPSILNGRHPGGEFGSNKGAGTRKHEKSAYDVAGKAMKQLGILEDN